MSKKVDTKDLVERIASLARDRMARAPVVSIHDLKGARPAERPKTLLIIEDDESVRKSLQRIFAAEGYQMLLASGAQDLTNLLGDSPIDLVLLDIGLPWINGFELAAMMKAHKDLSKVPIVFISGHKEMSVLKKGFAVGAHDFITKPFDVVNVKRTVQTLLALNA
jgi:two-component system aerobic respiration control protein ArcA